MNCKQIFRAAVCLLVVCCLIVNTSLPQARAVAVVDDLAVGVLGYFLAMVCGVVLTVETTQHLMAVGESFKTSMESWGTTEEKEDVVAAWLSGVSIEEGVDYIFSLPVELAAGAAVWLESVIMGTTEVSFEVSNGQCDYRGYLLPDVSGYITSDFPYCCISYKGGYYYCVVCSDPFISNGSSMGAVSIGTSGIPDAYAVYKMEKNGTAWVFSHKDDAPSLPLSAMSTSSGYTFVWANQDFWHNDLCIYSVVDPVPSVSNEILSPEFFGDIPIGIQDGTLTADGITLPNTIDYADLITDGSSVVDSVISLPGSIVDDDTYDDALALLTLTYADTEVVPDTTTPAEPEVSTPAVSLDGTLADTNAGTFVDVLIDAIAVPFEWLAGTLLDGIAGLFIPSEGYIDAKVDALKSEFAFANSIAQTGNAFKTFFVDMGMKPPIIYIDFSSARGSFSPSGQYALGGKAVFVDLTWYAEYKPTVDALLSAFLWLWFCWRMLLSLPGILQGTSGMWGFGDSLAGFEPWSIPRRLDSGSSGRLLGTSEHHQRFNSERKRFWER